MPEPTQEEIDQIFTGVHDAHRPYVDLIDDEAILDGHFTADHLEAIVALMRKYQKPEVI